MKSITLPFVAAFLPLSSGCQSTGRHSATGAAAETELRQLAAASAA